MKKIGITITEEKFEEAVDGIAKAIARTNPERYGRIPTDDVWGNLYGYESAGHSGGIQAIDGEWYGFSSHAHPWGGSRFFRVSNADCPDWLRRYAIEHTIVVCG